MFSLLLLLLCLVVVIYRLVNKLFTMYKQESLHVYFFSMLRKETHFYDQYMTESQYYMMIHQRVNEKKKLPVYFAYIALSVRLSIVQTEGSLKNATKLA